MPASKFLSVLDVITEADWVINLRPNGGDPGGRVVAQGPPDKLVRTRRRSQTAWVLGALLEASPVD